MKGYAEPANILHVQSLGKWRSLLRSSRGPAPSTFLLGTRDEFELQRRALAALDAMRVRLPHVLSSGQDQMPRPVHLFTAASPLRDEQGAVAGILLVTRDVTSLKLALLESERALAEKTTQLLNVEVGVKQSISVETVRRHVKAMFRKTGVHSQEALVKLFAE